MDQVSSTLPSVAATDTIDLLYELAIGGDLPEALREAEHLHYPLLAALCKALGCPMKRMSGGGSGIHLGRLIDALCDMVAMLKEEHAAEAEQRASRKVTAKDDVERECFMREIEREARKMRWEAEPSSVVSA